MGTAPFAQIIGKTEHILRGGMKLTVDGEDVGVVQTGIWKNSRLSSSLPLRPVWQIFTFTPNYPGQESAEDRNVNTLGEKADKMLKGAMGNTFEGKPLYRFARLEQSLKNRFLGQHRGEWLYYSYVDEELQTESVEKRRQGKTLSDDYTMSIHVPENRVFGYELEFRDRRGVVLAQLKTKEGDAMRQSMSGAGILDLEFLPKVMTKTNSGPSGSDSSKKKKVMARPAGVKVDPFQILLATNAILAQYAPPPTTTPPPPQDVFADLLTELQHSLKTGDDGEKKLDLVELGFRALGLFAKMQTTED